MHDKPIIFVVDDDASVRQSMTWLIESNEYTVEAYESAVDFLAQAEHSCEGCLVLDVRMPGISGLELQERLSEMKVDLPIIFITGHGDVPICVQAYERGAFGFLEKPVNHHKLLEYIHRAVEHHANVRQSRASNADIASRVESLTPREHQVMDLLAVGKTVKQIAGELEISIQTSSKHRARIWEKLAVQNDVELVRALGAGRQQPPE
jgi:FixJ family two-component response regulator